MKKDIHIIKTTLILFLLISCSNLYAADNHENKTSTSKKIFTKEDIEAIADKYVHNNLHKINPVFIDLNNYGKFDMLVFNHGIVEYYKNTNTLEEPFFVLENPHYDKYEATPILKSGMPMPIFFADGRGNGKMDIFGVKELGFNDQTNKYDYRILHAENSFDLDTGTLITIILVLVIILLVLAILR